MVTSRVSADNLAANTQGVNANIDFSVNWLSNIVAFVVSFYTKYLQQ